MLWWALTKGYGSGTLRKHSRSIVRITAERSIPEFMLTAMYHTCTYNIYTVIDRFRWYQRFGRPSDPVKRPSRPGRRRNWTRDVCFHAVEKTPCQLVQTCFEGIYLWFGAPKWIRALNINGETYMKCWEAGHAEKHTICWKAGFVVTLSCLFFWWKWWSLNAEKQVMLRSTKSAEKHVLLWNVYFFTEMVKLKCWEAGHAEKHKICWKACIVVKCLFFDGIGET